MSNATSRPFPNKKAQTLQNKIVDGGVADNQHMIILPANTTANLSALGRQQAALAYDSTLNEVVVDTGSGFSPVAAGGAVTSVALSLPAEFTVSGSPVTSSGTLTATKATQAANIVYAGPASGGVLAPTFRALVAADLPVLAFASSAGAGGAASATLTVTGLLATDTVLAVSQKTAGANSLPLLGWTTVANNALTVQWSADPGAGSVVVISVKR